MRSASPTRERARSDRLLSPCNELIAGLIILPFESPRMSRTLRIHDPAIVPEQARPVANYHMAARRESSRLVYISGQVAWDAECHTVAQGNIRAQAWQVFRNLR